MQLVPAFDSVRAGIVAHLPADLNYANTMKGIEDV